MVRHFLPWSLPRPIRTLYSWEEDPRLNSRQGYLIAASSFRITLRLGARMVIAKHSNQYGID